MGPDPEPAELLRRFLAEVVAAGRKGKVLDLACGSGQNGELLLQQGVQVVFADRSAAALDRCRARVARLPKEFQANASYWQVDFEQPDYQPLAGQQYAAMMVFRYLYRPLIPAIRDALVPGGLLIYETFTLDNRQFGRPSNPEFLLKRGELESWFADWQLLHRDELIEHQPVDRAVAQLVALNTDFDSPQTSR